MIPTATIVVNLDTGANTKSFNSTKGEMKTMTANQVRERLPFRAVDVEMIYSL
jgi:hypothetical protein